MAEIIPRWEWRTFGTEFGLAEEGFAAMTPSGMADSDEFYFLAPGGANVKIRDGLLDIKELQETDADGLERWLPIMKQAFPLSAEDVTAVVSSLGIAPISLERDTYTLDEFLDELIDPSPEIRVVNVRKHRVRYLVGGCMSELTDVLADGHHTRTIAVESEDKPAVLEAVRSLGLAGYLNTNYPTGLRTTIDGRSARYAVIDIGTNSVKFNLGERGTDGEWRTLTDRAEVTRLGEDLDKGNVIIADALERTTDAIAGMVAQTQAAGALAIVAVGTAGLRIAQNGEDVVAAIKHRTGVPVEIISGPEESRLAYLAAKTSLGTGTGTLVIFDSGGGSSQFTCGEGNRVTERFSVDVGAVRYSETYRLDQAVSDAELGAAMSSVSADLSRLDNATPPDALVGMGGTLTNIAAVSHAMATYNPDVIQGTVLDVTEIERQIEMYRSMDADARRTVVGLQPNRAEVILAGACIVATIMNKLAQQSVTVSDRGLRHGLTVERFGARLTS